MRRCCLIHLEQFDLPAAAIKLGDRKGRQREVVGQEHQRLALVGLEPNAPQRIGVARLGVEDREGDRLIADQSARAVHRMGVAALGLEIGLGTRDEEGPVRCKRCKRSKSR